MEIIYDGSMIVSSWGDEFWLSCICDHNRLGKPRSFQTCARKGNVTVPRNREVLVEESEDIKHIKDHEDIDTIPMRGPDDLHW